MTTRPVRSIIDDQLDDIEEFAGKSIRQAVELANRHGYHNPFFADICGDLCVLRFRRSSRLPRDNHPHPEMRPAP